jgi:membrane fusion protein, multidrug efflux system
MSSAFRMTLAYCALIIVSGCQKPPTTVAKPVRPVLSLVVAASSANDMALAGTVQPRIQSAFGFRVLGRLIARPVNVGDVVEKGQVLAAIDPVALDLAVKAVAADVSNSQAQLANAAGIEERQSALLRTNATTKAAYELAQQALAAAQANVKRAESALAKAREQLDYAIVKSDFAGVVTAVGAEVGQVVSPGQPVATVAQLDSRDAVVDVPDALASSMQPGTRFTISPQLNLAMRVGGAVRETAPEADATTRTRRVRIALDNPPETFRLGSTITASLAAASAPAFHLPASALLEKDGHTQVWVVDSISATVSLREVKVARAHDDPVTVLSGLEPAMRVVTVGVHSLSEGQTVKIGAETAR